MANSNLSPKEQVKSVSPTGVDTVDSLLTPMAWASAQITYSFPDEETDVPDHIEGFRPASSQIADAARWALDISFGSAANDGFSVEGFTRLRIKGKESDEQDAHLRIMQSSALLPQAALPGGPEGGDITMGYGSVDFSDAVHGDFKFDSVKHEIGHALGLEHPHAIKPPFPVLDASLDAEEYTIMSYNGFVGDTRGGYTIEQFGYAQTFMMLDIAALQALYGANYTVNAGKTVYSWKPGEGDTWVNGEIAINTPGDVIFATIWDGGGRDVFDLSAYATDLAIDLRPGESSVFDAEQLSDLSYFNVPGVNFASGNIYNSLLYKGDRRSLIEDARGGSGNDSFVGNAAKNRFFGNDGDDAFDGGKGNDRYVGGAGSDTYIFAKGGRVDTIIDFEFGADRIDLTDFAFAGFEDVKSLISDGKARAIVDLGDGDRIVLLGANTKSLDADDFIL